MTPIHLDGGDSRESVLAALAGALRFPDWFGLNLDALADSLADTAGDLVLVWRDWSLLAEADPETFTEIVEILRERAESPGFALLLTENG